MAPHQRAHCALKFDNELVLSGAIALTNAPNQRAKLIFRVGIYCAFHDTHPKSIRESTYHKPHDALNLRNLSDQFAAYSKFWFMSLVTNKSGL